jgi:ribosomal protein S18 acetylase RimI-like enzyme
MPITVRRATLDDYEAMSALFDEIHREHVEALPQVFKMPDAGPVRPREMIAEQLADPGIRLFVAEVEGVVAGLLDLRIQHTTGAPILVARRRAMVDAIVVSRAFRRQGVGRALMRRAEQWAQEHGISEVGLSVWEVNAGAVAFYEALGYTTVVRRMARQVE